MATRRSFIQNAAGITATSALTGFTPNLLAETTMAHPQVETGHGRVEGRRLDGIDVFKGIRYGAPTGNRRFQPAARPESWGGVRAALDYGPRAVQGGATIVGDEDCLFLNVWTPAANDHAKRPVMVWLHGGGFSSGSGASPLYDGTSLAVSNDVVVVTLNHRLNVFSALQLDQLLGQDYAESGCVGMLDIVQALEWVRDNITAFGGDPDRVLVFGESGGGRKVSTLLAMPAATGLFHRAVIQSGAILRVAERDDAARLTDELLRTLGIDRTRAHELTTIDPGDLLRAYQRANANFEPRQAVVGMAAATPILGATTLPAHPFDPTATPISADVPVIVGYTAYEEALFYRLKDLMNPLASNREMDFDMTAAELRDRVAARLGVDPTRLLEAYAADYSNESPWERFLRICTDHPRGSYPQILAARRAQSGAAPTYVYRFDWEMNDEVKAFHALEIPFVFNNTHVSNWTKDHPDEPQRLAQAMSAAWASFARSGVPSGTALPTWEPYDETTRSTMLFANPPTQSHDPNRRSREAMAAVLSRG